MSIKRTLLSVLALTALTSTLAACSAAKEQLGLTKNPPDEFAVIRRAPLDMPPDYYLRPPEPGAPRPQEQAPAQEARQSLFGEPQYDPELSEAENLLLQQAGADSASPSIRTTVDRENKEIGEDKRPVAQRLLGIGEEEPSATIVDAPAEAERLIRNEAEGKAATDGETPSFED